MSHASMGVFPVPVRRALAVLTLAAVLGGVVGCGPGDLPQFVHAGVLAKASLRYYWDMKLSLDEGETVERMYLMDENLYCLTNENRLLVVDAAVGGVKWHARIANKDQTVYRPCHADNVVLPEKVSGIKEILNLAPEAQGELFDAVLINTLSKIFVFDRANGAKKREIQLNFPANTGGACDGELFYVASTKGWCHAFLLREAMRAWAISTAGLITAPIEYHAGHIYVASQDGSLYAAQAGRMNNIIWRRPLPAPITAGFGVDDRGCFVPCEDNRIYALNALTGEPLWDPFICEGHLLEPIQVGVSTLFQRAEGDKFYALNLANGRLRWTRPAGRLILAVISGKAYLLDDTGALQVVDEVLGSVSASFPLTGMELFAANTTAPAIYVGNREGYLFCIRPRRAGRLTAQMLEKSGR